MPTATRGMHICILNNSESAVADYEKCLKIDPKNLDGWNQKGLALMNLGKFQDALDCLRRGNRRLG